MRRAATGRRPKASTSTILQLEEQNPELYKQYLKALRDYKAGEHKVVLVSMDNTTSAPAQRNEHLTTMPDSVDIICLMNPDNLHPTLAGEFAKVREKGTRVIYNIDYNAIEKLWEKVLADEEANKPEEPTNPSTPRRPRTKAAKVAARANRLRGGAGAPFLEFCRQQTVSQLNLCAKYGYDGVQVNYTGRALQAMREEEKAQYAARQEAFFSNVKTWNEANSGKVLVFQGNPQNLIDKSVLGECDYIVIPALTATSADKMSFAVLMAAVEDVPTDRFVIGVTTPSLTDLSDESGYFSGYEADGKTRVRATKGAAQWVVSPASGYEKLGISIANAQNDYFNLTLVYKNIREAVDILNPAPKN
ncbi:MAG: glycoside hydrolase family 18 [Alistipes onderdonkii]